MSEYDLSPEELAQIEEEIAFLRSPAYKACALRGHDFVWRAQWFRYGWRWPWCEARRWRRCRGCGIGEYVPKERKRP